MLYISSAIFDSFEHFLDLRRRVRPFSGIRPTSPVLEYSSLKS
jgi:hypothetical protein